MKSRSLLALCAAVTGIAVSCGGSTNGLLEDTAANLTTIRSGILALRLDVSSTGSLAGRVGFELRGPFALPPPGKLPVARLEFTRITGDQETNALLISTGDEAFVGLGGQVYELPSAETEQLRAPPEGDEGNPLALLRIDDWMQEPKISGGGRVGGAATERIHGDLDVVNAINDLLDLTGQLGPPELASVPRLEGDSADQVRRAVRSATMDVFTGSRDHLLRRLLLQIQFGASPPPQLRAVAGAFGAARLVLELDVTDPNRPVHVAVPPNALPSSSLPGAA
jgi:hypothetical protein